MKNGLRVQNGDSFMSYFMYVHMAGYDYGTGTLVIATTSKALTIFIKDVHCHYGNNLQICFS